MPAIWPQTTGGHILIDCSTASKNWIQLMQARWQDVLSIRFASVGGGRYDGGAGLIFVEGPRHTFHLILRSNAFLQTKGRLLVQCTRAVIMEDYMDNIRAPKAGDADWRRSQTRKYARRMVTARAWHNGIACLAVLIVGEQLFRHYGPSFPTGLISIVCMLIIVMLVADAYHLAKRLGLQRDSARL